MNSFDVFDTLIARRHVTARPIFEQIAREVHSPSFAEARARADDGQSSLADIYHAIGAGPDIMARELALEHEHAVPIQENLDRVRDGDLLISDMYLDARDILSLLRTAGLNRQVTLYRSNGGKASGDVWRRILRSKPDRHLGDNRMSDFVIPRACGISCELFEKTRFTEFELYLHSSSLPAIALLMREVRLRGNPPAWAIFQQIAGQLNLPWLFLFAELLHRRDPRTKVFLGRDCQLLHLLHQAYFAPGHYLPFSRRLAYGQPEEAVRYLLSQAPEDALFVDLCSTGGTWEKLQAPLDITVGMYMDNYHYTPCRPVLPDRFSALATSSACGHANAAIEVFNCGDHGYIEAIDRYDDGLFRAVFSDQAEFDDALVSAIHAPVKLAVGLARFYRESIRAELAALEETQLTALFQVLALNISRQSHVEQLIPRRRENEAAYLIAIRRAAGDP